MRMFPMFAEFLFEKELSLDLKKLENLSYKRKELGFGEVTVTGSWKSELLSVEDDELNLLKTEILNSSKVVLDNLCCNYDDFFIEDMWLNICNLGHNIHPHDHGLSMFSGSFYVRTQESSFLHFISSNQKNLNHFRKDLIKEFNEYNSNFYRVKSVENKLLIFPSWTTHYSDVNQTTEDRISIAFNIGVKV